MTDDVFHTIFSGEVKIVSKMDVISYEVWVNGKHLKSTETLVMAFCWLYDYLRQIALENATRQIIAKEVEMYSEN